MNKFLFLTEAKFLWQKKSWNLTSRWKTLILRKTKLIFSDQWRYDRKSRLLSRIDYIKTYNRTLESYFTIAEPLKIGHKPVSK